MNPHDEQALREQWPHLAEHFIAVDAACERWLQHRGELRRRRNANERRRVCHNPADAGRDGAGDQRPQ